MIPELNDHGYLPPGVFSATLDEIDARFAKESEIRRAEMESLRWLMPLAKRVGAMRMIVNGSFTTDVLEPNDVDCVLLIDDSFPLDESAAAELAEGLPFIQLHLVEKEGYDYFVNTLFAWDTKGIAKGMIEVIL